MVAGQRLNSIVTLYNLLWAGFEPNGNPVIGICLMYNHHNPMRDKQLSQLSQLRGIPAQPPHEAIIVAMHVWTCLVPPIGLLIIPRCTPYLSQMYGMPHATRKHCNPPDPYLELLELFAGLSSEQPQSLIINVNRLLRDDVLNAYQSSASPCPQTPSRSCRLLGAKSG